MQLKLMFNVSRGMLLMAFPVISTNVVNFFSVMSGKLFECHFCDIGKDIRCQSGKLIQCHVVNFFIDIHMLHKSAPAPSVFSRVFAIRFIIFPPFTRSVKTPILVKHLSITTAPRTRKLRHLTMTPLTLS